MRNHPQREKVFLFSVRDWLLCIVMAKYCTKQPEGKQREAWGWQEWPSITMVSWKQKAATGGFFLLAPLIHWPSTLFGWCHPFKLVPSPSAKSHMLLKSTNSLTDTPEACFTDLQVSRCLRSKVPAGLKILQWVGLIKPDTCVVSEGRVAARAEEGAVFLWEADSMMAD